jgi:hypothetical protein
MRRAMLFLALLAVAPAIFATAASAAAAPAKPTTVDEKTWVDDDARPVAKPKPYEQKLYAHQAREAIIEPLSSAFDVPDKILWLVDKLGGNTEHQSENVNAFDEVPNSMWFTNRNHVKSVAPHHIRLGWKGENLQPKKPWSIRSAKVGGVNPGFNIKDADGKRWVVKLDKPGYPQLASGADAISTRLVWAAGYNVPHDVPIKFEAKDLEIDEELAKGKDGAPPFTRGALDTLLARGHRGAGGVQYGQASLFVEGEPIGPIASRKRRKDDANDLFVHRDRRELRGLYVLMSWLQSWDTKDHQTFQAFVPVAKDAKTGATKSYILDVGASLGAAAEGPKPARYGYEYTIDWGWIARRALSLGFAVEPWRHAKQETGIPSLGNLEADQFDPDDFKSLQPHPAFDRRTLRDSYWGAKLVASFNEAQIAAAIDAAGYEDERVKPRLLALLVARRDKIAREWFGRVAPLDFFHIDGRELRFHDLAVDRRYAPARHYDVRVLDDDGGKVTARSFELAGAALPLERLGNAAAVELEFRVVGLGAAPVRVALARSGTGAGAAWVVTRVRHA